MMRINQGELAELLQDDIGYVGVFIDLKSGDMLIELEWGASRSMSILEHLDEQTYNVISTTSHDMFPGHTISVDEILDIVL